MVCVGEHLFAFQYRPTSRYWSRICALEVLVGMTSMEMGGDTIYAFFSPFNHLGVEVRYLGVVSRR